MYSIGDVCAPLALPHNSHFRTWSPCWVLTCAGGNNQICKAPSKRRYSFLAVLHHQRIKTLTANSISVRVGVSQWSGDNCLTAVRIVALTPRSCVCVCWRGPSRQRRKHCPAFVINSPRGYCYRACLLPVFVG